MVLAGVIVETPRLLIREWRPSDIGAAEAIYQDPETMQYMGAGAPYEPAVVAAAIGVAITKHRERGYAMWALEERATGALVGHCGLQPLGDEVEIGVLIERSRWGRGYATEAEQAVLGVGFTTLGLSKIVALVQPANVASVVLLRHLGFEIEAEIEHGGRPHLKFMISREVFDNGDARKGPGPPSRQNRWHGA